MNTDLFFGINMPKLLRLGALDVSRLTGDAPVGDLQLSSEESLFCRLWASDMMRSHIHNKGDTITREGELAEVAHIIFQGQAVATWKDRSFYLGPGAVFGLAEGLCEQAHRWTVQADTILHTRTIPISQALEELRQSSPGLRSICRVAAARVLGLTHAPTTL
jgi:CRP-like cAMP-binding protein